jgi:hypothetical protein
MVIVRFRLKECVVTWFINDYWFMLVSFLIPVFLGVFLRRIRKSNETKKVLKPKGGAFIDDCVDPNFSYELMDNQLVIIIKRMLNLKPSAGPVIITPSVLFMGYYGSRELFNQLNLLGVTFLIENSRDFIAKIGIGVISGSILIFTPIGVTSLLVSVLVTTILLDLSRGLYPVECDNILRKLDTVQISKNLRVSYLDPTPLKSPKIFLKGNEGIDLYFSNDQDSSSCSSEVAIIPSQKSTTTEIRVRTKPAIDRGCNKRYVPLNERTKTLADLKFDDSTNIRQKAESSIKRYEKRRNKIMNSNVFESKENDL